MDSAKRTASINGVISHALVHQGAVDEAQDSYPVLVLNNQSWEILRGQPQPSKPTGDEVAVDDDLFQKLRTHRKRLADAAGVPPYVVFHDSTLREMAHRTPQTADAFAIIPGVGQTKLERYAESFAQVIGEHHSKP